MLRILGRANSFNVRKVLWVCDELGVPYTREDWGRGYRPTTDGEFRKINPIGLVPAVIDDGVVLTVAEPRDMVASIATELERIDEEIGGVDFVLGFECVLRRLEAETRQIKRNITDLYRRYHVAGFHTYGEQYNAMHLNQTFTGVAIGHRGIE